MATSRVRLGHMVVCTGFRNPALTAKLSSTIDVISGGRFELGIGAGWKEEEWLAYGYGFPTLGERLAALGDHLEVIQAMFAPGSCQLRGPLRPRPAARSTSRKGSRSRAIPIIVGGNGEHVTAGYAIRYADELNCVFLAPDEMRQADGRRSRALRGRGSRPVHPAVLALHPRRGDARTRAGPDRHAGAAAARSGSTGSSASRGAGTRRSRGRRASRRTCARPGSTWPRSRWRPLRGYRRVVPGNGSRLASGAPAAGGGPRIRPIRRGGA